MTSTLALANLLFFLQATAPAQKPHQPAGQQPSSSSTTPAPAAAAATPPPTTPPASAAPPPPRPTVPVLPHSPDDAASFLHVFHLEQELAKESETYFKSAQDHLNQDKAKMDGLNLLLTDEMKELRAKESWGPEVLFNPQTEKFERPLPGSAQEKTQPKTPAMGGLNGTTCPPDTGCATAPEPPAKPAPEKKP